MVLLEHPEPIPAGAAARIEARATSAFYPRALLPDLESALNFKIVSLKIGRQEQIVGNAGVPAVLLCFSPPFKLGLVNPRTRIVLRVQNASRDPHRFRAELTPAKLTDELLMERGLGPVLPHAS